MPKIDLAETDPYSLAKMYARQGAYVRKIKIGGNWVSKCFLQRCPKCFSKLPSMLTHDGWEYCVKGGCTYNRQVYTKSELKLLGR